MPIKFKYLQHYKDRYGNPWVYVRHNGHKIRIKETIGSPEFARAYGDAIHRLNSPGPIDPNRKNETDHAKPGTLGWLAAQYFTSTRFTRARSQPHLAQKANARRAPGPSCRGSPSSLLSLLLLPRAFQLPACCLLRKG
jgi:hypothetical protein